MIHMSELTTKPQDLFVGAGITHRAYRHPEDGSDIPAFIVIWGSGLTIAQCSEYVSWPLTHSNKILLSLFCQSLGFQIEEFRVYERNESSPHIE